MPSNERATTEAAANDRILTARPCSFCGRHEIAVVTDAREFIPLRPGMQVRIIHEADHQEGAYPRDE